jgi:hypothetical protein
MGHSRGGKLALLAMGSNESSHSLARFAMNLNVANGLPLPPQFPFSQRRRGEFGQQPGAHFQLGPHVL